MQVVLDVETTVDDPLKAAANSKNDRADNKPFKTNKLVSVQYKVVGTKEEDFVTFNHKEFTGSQQESFRVVQDILDKTTLLIGHNLRFDLLWLRECGFKYDGAVWDTMIFEYIQIKGMKTGLSLEAVSEKYGLEMSKSNFLMDNFRKGINTDEMPLAGLTEYGMLDVYLTEEVFLKQQEKQDPDTVFMRPALDLTNEYMPVLVDMERAGAYIDLDELETLETDYTAEHQQLLEGLQNITREVMGDKPYNLSSPAQLSEIVYGFSVNDKKLWAEIFNIGSEVRNGVKKKKYQTKLSEREVDKIIKENTTPLYITEAHQCDGCGGKGYIQKFKVNGEPYKKTNICQKCLKAGYVYVPTEKRAGLGLKHPGSRFATVNGFAVDKPSIDLLLERAAAKDRLNDKGLLAVDFLKALQRLGSVENYLNSFIKKIKENQVDNILHVNFNQCVTATGRLSSTFHNLPKGGVFPVKKAIVSRFKGGKILSCDLAQIDFRAAVYLAQCEKGMKFLEEKQDIHMVSSRFYNPDAETITKEMRTKAKAYCVPMHTKALTRHGWKYYDELSVGEDILAYNPESGVNEWTPILELAKFEEEEVLEIRNKHNFVVQCTPDHRWIGRRRSEVRGIRQNVNNIFHTSENATTEHWIRVSSVAEGGELDINPSDAALIGWIYTDGHLRISKLTGNTSQAGGDRQAMNASIIQKKQKGIDAIEKSLAESNLSYTKYLKDESGCYAYTLRSPETRRLFERSGIDRNNIDLVSWVIKLSQPARKAFLEACSLAEGTVRKGGEIRISQNEGMVKEAMLLAAYLEGYSTRSSRKITWAPLQTKEHYLITLRTRQFVGWNRLTKTSIGKQSVWCPRTKFGTWVMRQGETITITGNTFRPLYGGQDDYTEHFYSVFPGIRRWHQKLINEALNTKQTKSPFGRIFSYPNVERKLDKNGNPSCSYFTQISNYQVQGAATGDIMPAIVINIYKQMKALDVKSRLILTVHDDLTADIHPEEIDLMLDIFRKGFNSVYDECKRRYDLDINVPIDYELSIGDNWMEKKEVV